MGRCARFGEAGVEVSALCLGCMFFGTRVDAAKSERLLDRYTAAGGAFLDTANNYAFWVAGGHGGQSESLLGRWMRRLDTDHIDLYYAHVDHRSVALEETLAAFGELVTAGKVRYIGCSNFAAWRVERARRISDARGLPRYCCVQQRLSYLRPRAGTTFDTQLAADDGLLDFCRTNPEVALLAYSPLLSGAYTVPGRELPAQYRGPDTDARLAALARVAQSAGASANQIVLAWLIATTPAAIPLIAGSNDAQLDDNLGSLTVELSPDQLATLDAAGT
jgi:aryl-alcohol dehydrogenase-like predicted oxidoreductase